jgi:Family of unknown function (DUF6226)
MVDIFIGGGGPAQGIRRQMRPSGVAFRDRSWPSTAPRRANSEDLAVTADYFRLVTVLGDVQAQVVRNYASLRMPRWRNPRGGMESPRDEEYSRVTSPARYRIVHARAGVWAEVLGQLPGIAAASLVPAPLDFDGRLGMFDRGLCLTSPRVGTLPLLLLERDAPLSGQEGSLAVLHVSVVAPEVSVAMLPGCGCDACDSGSDDLLDAIDEVIGHVVGGRLVVLRGPRWDALWYSDGGRSGGAGSGPDHVRMMDLCRRLANGEDVPIPQDAVSFVGQSWLI